MKTKFEKALNTAEPTSPKLLKNVNTRRRPPTSSLPIRSLLSRFRGIDNFLDIGPEHLVFGLLDITEVVPFHREDEHARRAHSHQ
jgi:hypothetical protein